MTTSRALATALCAVLGGCASIKTTSQSLPGAVPPGFRQLLVAAITPDLPLRLAAESAFVRAATTAGVQVVAYHDLFLVGGTYADAEILAALRERNIPAILVVTDATTDAPTVSAQALAIPLCYAYVGGRCISGSTVVAASSQARQDNFTILSQVFELDGTGPIWIGSTRIQRQGATDRALISGLAKDVVATLMSSGILRHP